MNQAKRREDIRKEFPGDMRKNIPSPLYATLGRFEGEVNLQWDAVPGARAYIIQVSKNPNDKWEQIDVVDEPQYNIAGLQSKRKYLFRVAAVFGDRQGKWSEPFIKKIF